MNSINLNGTRVAFDNIDMGALHIANDNRDALGGTPIPGVVGWTYEDAAQEVKNGMRARRLARLHDRAPRARKPVAAVATPELSDAEFEALTGWTRQDALEMALECRSEELHFGGRRQAH